MTSGAVRSERRAAFIIGFLREPFAEGETLQAEETLTLVAALPLLGSLLSPSHPLTFLKVEGYNRVATNDSFRLLTRETRDSFDFESACRTSSLKE